MRQAGRKRKKTHFKQHILTCLAGLTLFLFASLGNGRYTAICESLPYFTPQVTMEKAFKYESGQAQNEQAQNEQAQNEQAQQIQSSENENSEIQNLDDSEGHSDIVGIEDITFETDSSGKGQSTAPKLTADVIAKMQDVEYLKKYFYLVDSRTQLLPGDINATEFLNKDLSLDNSKKGPKILIFHTHAAEGFTDSDMAKDMNEGIWGAGEKLKEILENEYNIETLHDMGRYDKVEGKSQILGAYERMEPSIQKILAANPSIEVVIDMHRDGLPENVHLVTEIDGKPCAKIMFFNGMCRLNKDGEASAIAGLENPYLDTNLAFSLQMQAAANKEFPDFTRRIYLNAYRYSLHMKPKSLFVEVGSQMNSKEEIHNAMTPLAKLLAEVLGQP